MDILTYGLYEGGAGGLDHQVGVQEDGLEERLGVGRQLGDQGSQSEVDCQSVIRELTHPEEKSQSGPCQSVSESHLARTEVRKGPSVGAELSAD